MSMTTPSKAALAAAETEIRDTVRDYFYTLMEDSQTEREYPEREVTDILRHLVKASNAPLVAALGPARYLALAWAIQYQSDHNLEEIHPIHQEIITKADEALANFKTD